MNGPGRDIPDRLRPVIGGLPERLGLAVSGGSDSTALMHIVAQMRPGVAVATVDHGLRAESAQEAREVARQAAGLGLSHDTLVWEGWGGSGNLQDSARRARFGLLAQWARRRGLDAVALGHTADDQAETMLMRLARASGVDGLSGIPQRRVVNGVTFERPLLSVRRQDLRDWLGAQGVGWVEDASNFNTDFDRIRIRNALPGLADLGITAQKLGITSENAALARAALETYADRAIAAWAHEDAGAVYLSCDLFGEPEETVRRVFQRVLRGVGGAEYPARRAALRAFIGSAKAGETATLAGCLTLRLNGKVLICREYSAVCDLTSAPADLWDARWQLTGPDADFGEIRALGRDGLAQINWRAVGRARVVLMASPSVWRGAELIAAPLAGVENGWHATLMRPAIAASGPY